MEAAAMVQRLSASPEVQAHLRSSRTGVYIVRNDGHIVWASPSMAAVTGRSPEELVGSNGWDVFVAPEQLPQVARFKAMLSESDGVIWMALRMPGDARAWFRVETWVREGHILCAFTPEADKAQWNLHFVTRPRPR